MARTKKTPVVEAKVDSINIIDNMLKDLEPKTITKDWNGINITVKDKISNVDAMKFTQIVADLCFTDTGEYLPEVFEYAVSYATVSIYSDFLLPSTVAEQYKLFMFTDIVQEILNHVDSHQYEAIFEATKEKIDYRLKTEVEAIKKQAEEMIASVDTLLTKLNDTFGEFDNKEIKGLVKALSSGKIDEKKIMDAYLNSKKGK